jgi:DNA topoisomerase-1
MEGKNLVIVESPGKVKTIQQYLGKDYLVKASIGHIRDLEEHKLSVDVEHGFQPQYVVPSDKKKVVADLKKLSTEAATVWLASDEDREGEAISWHLRETLGLPREKTRRIVFHEITKNAILEAIEHPRDIDMNLVNAQQARRVLDRLVGFELSPILWRKIQPKLSAGRVQSVALRLIVDREKEIMAFTPEPFYRIEATFSPEGVSTPVKALLDTRFPTEEEARKFLEDSIGATYRIASIEKKDGVRVPAPPFTTSTLQQEAARKLHFPVSTTMRVAQTLYERGLITTCEPTPPTCHPWPSAPPNSSSWTTTAPNTSIPASTIPSPKAPRKPTKPSGPPISPTSPSTERRRRKSSTSSSGSAP